MNNVQLYKLVEDYPVTICAADQLEIAKGQYVIANTDTSDGKGLHWVTFYFPKRGPYEFFDSIGNSPKDYEVGFEKILDKPFYMIDGPLQQSGSTVCGLYCAYYIIQREEGLSLNAICNQFNQTDQKANDRFVVNYMKPYMLKHLTGVRF